MDDQHYAQNRRAQLTIELRCVGRRDFPLGTIADFPQRVRTRLSSPEFYQTLQQQITATMLGKTGNPINAQDRSD